MKTQVEGRVYITFLLRVGKKRLENLKSQHVTGPSVKEAKITHVVRFSSSGELRSLGLLPSATNGEVVVPPLSSEPVVSLGTTDSGGQLSFAPLDT